jgi:hypothetical protein
MQRGARLNATEARVSFVFAEIILIDNKN